MVFFFLVGRNEGRHLAISCRGRTSALHTPYIFVLVFNLLCGLDCLKLVSLQKSP